MKQNEIFKFFRELIENDKKFMVAIFFIIVLFGGALWIFRFMILFGFSAPGSESVFDFIDLKAYLKAAEIYLNGNDIYDESLYTDEKIYGLRYTYFPLTLLFFIPFLKIPFFYTALLFMLLNIILLGITIFIITKILEFYNVKLSLTKKILLFFAVFLFYPVNTTFTHGQVNIIILFIITLAYYFIFCKTNSNISSICLSFGTIFKIWPLFLSFSNFFHKKAKGLFFKSILFTSILFSISLLIFGLNTHINYIQMFFRFQKIPLYSSNEVLNPKDPLETNMNINNSILKLIALLNVNEEAFLFANFILLFIKVIIIISLLYFFFSNREKLKKFKEYDALLFSLLIISSLFIPNKTWAHYGTFLVLTSIILIFVSKLNLIEKILFFLFVLLFSIQTYILVLARIIGNPLISIIYIANPATYAYISFFILIFYSIYRRAKM